MRNNPGAQILLPGGFEFSGFAKNSFRGAEQNRAEEEKVITYVGKAS